MTEAISRLKRLLASGRLTNEAAVREAAVLPILAEIGWEIFDPDIVAREYPLGKGRVDYALSPRNGVPSVIIEVKRDLTTSDSADQQLFQYAFHAGVPLAVLTDGREWAFYLPSGQGSYAERRFYKLDLSERTEIESLQRLRRYIGFEAVGSGAFRRSAEDDYQQLRDSRMAIEVLPAAWKSIVQDRESLLFEMIAEKAEDLCGVRPPAEAIEEFLLSEVGDFRQGSAVPMPCRYVRKPRESVAPFAGPASAPDLPTRAERRRGPTTYSYQGQDVVAPNAITATISLINQIEHEHPGSIAKAAPRVAGRRRRYLSNAPELLYDRAELVEFARLLENGWFIDTNISNGTKIEIVRAVADAAGLIFGVNADLTFENKK